MSKKPHKPQKINNSPYSFSMFSENRAVLMGIATLMIVIYHGAIHPDLFLSETLGIEKFSLSAFHSHLSAGVDSFLFLSGCGLYYSWHQDPDWKHFYQKRAVRILPELFIVMTIWNLFCSSDLSVAGYLKSMSFFHFWVNGSRYFWYFGLLLLLYLVYPLIHKLYDKFRANGLISLLSLCFLVTVLLYSVSPVYYKRIEIALYRVPAFLLGAWAGKMAVEKKKLPGIWVWASGILTVFLFLSYGFGKFPTGFLMRITESLLGLSAMVLWAAVFHKLKLKHLRIFLVWFGSYSMEIYLLYERVFSLLRNRLVFADTTGILRAFCFLVVTLVLAILLKNISNTISRDLFGVKQKASAK